MKDVWSKRAHEPRESQDVDRPASARQPRDADRSRAESVGSVEQQPRVGLVVVHEQGLPAVHGKALDQEQHRLFGASEAARIGVLQRRTLRRAHRATLAVDPRPDFSCTARSLR